MKNLSFFGDDGRASVHDVLRSVVDRLPTAVLDQFADLLFVALVLRSVNDDDTKCREKSAETIA